MGKIQRVTAIKYGETFIDEGMAYRGGDRAVKMPISLIIYLIDTRDKKILVDAGCDTMPGFELSHFCSPVEVLARMDIVPEEITDVILTHAHHDHAEATRHFVNATVHIEHREYNEAKRFIPEKMNLNIFSEEVTITEGVLVKRIGGHSRGSCVVEFDVDGKKYVMCGDECYTRRCLDEQIPTGSSVCPEKSLEFVQRYGTGEYIALLAHDVDILHGQNGFLDILS